MTPDERRKTIDQHRRNQPIAELERKARKAHGRWGRRYWTAEAIDLAMAEAADLCKSLRVE